MSLNNANVTENSALLGRMSESVESSPSRLNDDESAAINDTANEAQQLLWDELERPWPSTFERSIGLLASPIIKPQQVELFTKSPKPGSTPIALARRRNLDRGFYTPETGINRLPGWRRQDEEDDTIGLESSDIGGSFKMGIQRNQSLDYWKKNAISNIEKSQKTQQTKASKAKEYRDEILKKANKNDTAKKKSTAQTTDSHHGSSLVPDTSFTQCAFNLANILMGMGLLGLPYAFKAAGWFGGGLSVLSFGFVTWRTAILIGRELNGDPRPSHYFVDSPFKSPLLPGSDPRARMYPPITSFPDIARVTFGPTSCTILSILLYFELFSCIAIFLVSIGDHLHELFPVYSSSQLAIAATIVSLIPTILLRTPKLLSYFSMVGTFATVAVVMVVVGSALLEGDISDTNGTATAPTHIYWRPQGLVLSLGVVSYCFSGHAIVPSIYSSMKQPQEFEKMVTFTFAVVVGACFAVAVSGYYMFGNTVYDQVTISLKQNSKAVVIMNVLTVLMVVTAFSKITLTMYPLALGVEEIFSPYLTSEKMVDMCSITIKLSISIFAAGLAIFCPSFSFLCALTGMICTMSVSVIFPAAAHYKMFHQKLSLFEKLVDICMVVVGCIMAVVGTAVTIWQ